MFNNFKILHILNLSMGELGSLKGDELEGIMIAAETAGEEELEMFVSAAGLGRDLGQLAFWGIRVTGLPDPQYPIVSER